MLLDLDTLATDCENVQECLQVVSMNMWKDGDLRYLFKNKIKHP